MKWILGAFLGLVIAFFIYALSGALSNLLIGPLLGYRIQKITFFGGALICKDGKWKGEMDEFHLIPEVFLDTNVKQRWKKLILDIFPAAVGFCAGACISVLFGGLRGVYRHILIGTLSAMSVLYCWHIFIVLKMLVYMKENKPGDDEE